MLVLGTIRIKFAPAMCVCVCVCVCVCMRACVRVCVCVCVREEREREHEEESYKRGTSTQSNGKLALAHTERERERERAREREREREREQTNPYATKKEELTETTIESFDAVLSVRLKIRLHHTRVWLFGSFVIAQRARFDFLDTLHVKRTEQNKTSNYGHLATTSKSR